MKGDSSSSPDGRASAMEVHFGNFVYLPELESLGGHYVGAFCPEDPIWLSTFPSFRMDCKFCSCVESDTHALLEWPVAMRVGANIMVRCRIWTT